MSPVTGGKLGKSEKSSQAGVGFVALKSQKGPKKTRMALFRVRHPPPSSRDKSIFCDIRGSSPIFAILFKLNLRPRNPGIRCTLVIENWEKKMFSKILSRRSSISTLKNPFFSLGARFWGPKSIFHISASRAPF